VDKRKLLLSREIFLWWLWKRKRKKEWRINLKQKQFVWQIRNFPAMSSLLWLPSGAERNIVTSDWIDFKNWSWYKTHMFFSHMYFFFCRVFAFVLSQFFKYDETFLAQSVNRSVSFFCVYLCNEWPHRCIYIFVYVDPMTRWFVSPV